MNLLGIAFIGPIGSGKTETANALIDSMATLAQKFSFADRLRDEIIRAYMHTNKWDDWLRNNSVDYARQYQAEYDRILAEMLHPETKERWRPVLRAWGVMRRNENENYWLLLLRKDLLDWKPQNNVAWAFIDDCRFNNERDYLVGRGFKIVRLLPNESKEAFVREAHESEDFWHIWEPDLLLDWMPLEDRVAAVKAKFDIY